MKKRSGSISASIFSEEQVGMNGAFSWLISISSLLLNSGWLYHTDPGETKSTHNLDDIIIRQYQWDKIKKQL